MWENTAQAKQFLTEYYSAGGGSLRKRTFPTFENGIAAGLKPKSNNPMEYLVRYNEAMNDYIAQRRTARTPSVSVPACRRRNRHARAVRQERPAGRLCQNRIAMGRKQRGPTELEAMRRATWPTPSTISITPVCDATRRLQMSSISCSAPNHVIDLEWMKEAWRLTRKDGHVDRPGTWCQRLPCLY